MTCPCCGGSGSRRQAVLWEELIQHWGLSAEEVDYIDRQQGCLCASCGSNLRSQVLAAGVLRFFGFSGTLSAFVARRQFRRLRVMEINEAGHLTRWLSQMPGHELMRYPDVDMRRLPHADGTYDLVIHSDTLEHVPDPIQGLRECRRVLKAGGCCAFTVPIVVGRLTRSREGLAASYHGNSSNPKDCLVCTEYGADAWTQVIQAGFSECRIVALDFPAAHALVATA